MKFGHTFELLPPEGHKKCTSRIPAEKWYDWYKDVNMNPRRTVAEGINGEKKPIVLKFCTIQKLGLVKEKRFWDEGFSSPESFEQIWRRLYNNFNPEMQVCTIDFDTLVANIVYGGLP